MGQVWAKWQNRSSAPPPGPGVVWSTDGLQAWLTESGIEVGHQKCTSSGPSSDFRRKGTCRMPEVAQVSDLDLDTADQKAREMGFPPFPRD